MKAHLSRVDVSYEVLFKKPLLDRPSGIPAPLQTIYDALSENFAISIADVQVNQSTSPSQTSIAYSLFGGAGSIELRPDRWRGAFRSLLSEADVALITRCLKTASAAIERTSDRLAPSRTVLTVAGWYSCDVSREAVSKILEKYWLVGNELEPGFLDAVEIEHVLNPKLTNKVEGWEVSFYIAVSALDKTELFINYIGTYIAGGRYNSIDQQSEHIRGMLTGILTKLGFEPTVNEIEKNA